MVVIKKLFIGWLCISFSIFQILSGGTIAEASVTYTKPQSVSSPEETIPVAESPSKEKKGGSKWLWALLGVALIGGAAAAAGGGGGGGGDDDDDDGGGNGGGNGGGTGSLIISAPTP